MTYTILKATLESVEESVTKLREEGTAVANCAADVDTKAKNDYKPNHAVAVLCGVVKSCVRNVTILLTSIRARRKRKRNVRERKNASTRDGKRNLSDRSEMWAQQFTTNFV